MTLFRLRLAKLPSAFGCSFPVRFNSFISFYLGGGGKSGLTSFENFGQTSSVSILYICIDVYIDISINIEIDMLMLPSPCKDG